MPYISPKTEEDRVEKIRAARKRLGHKDTETMILISGSKSAPDKPVLARDIAAAIMGVGGLYVQWAMGVEREVGTGPEVSEIVSRNRRP